MYTRVTKKRVSRAKQPTSKQPEPGQFNEAFNPFIPPPVGQSYPSMLPSFRNVFPTAPSTFHSHAPAQQFPQHGAQLLQSTNTFPMQPSSSILPYVPAILSPQVQTVPPTASSF